MPRPGRSLFRPLCGHFMRQRSAHEPTPRHKYAWWYDLSCFFNFISDRILAEFLRGSILNNHAYLARLDLSRHHRLGEVARLRVNLERAGSRS
jgi:hypothetical protein